jgi:hypothetical protein
MKLMTETKEEARTVGEAKKKINVKRVGGKK